MSVPKNESISCIDQELKIDIIKFKGENGDKHLTIKVVIDQKFEVQPNKSGMPVRHVQQLVTQELEIY